MKKTLALTIIAASFLLIPQFSFAWGSRGHRLVASIAFHFLDDTTRQKVQQYLGKMSFEDAGTWMDDMRSNSYYNYMRTWHYVDIEKGETFKDAPQKNLISIVNAAINQLEKNQADLNDKDVRTDLLLIFHLIGDLHQPLHCGYTSDRGGNSINISADNFSNNLHSTWDTQIIEDDDISFYDCLQYYNSLTPSDIKAIDKINLVQWMYQSRYYLDTVYNFKNGYLDSNYLKSAKVIIEKQLLIGGMRLATILKEVMKNYPLKEPLKKMENTATENKEIKTVKVSNLSDYEGEVVKVCVKIVDGKYEGNTELDATDASKAELAIIILSKNRNNFAAPPETFYKDKNVCVTGRVETYKDKTTIFIKDERQITVQ